jgi:hypothetical protein
MLCLILHSISIHYVHGFKYGQMKFFIQCVFFCFLQIHAVQAEAQQVNSLWLSGSAGVNSNWILNQNAYGNQEIEYAPTFGFSGGLGGYYFKSRKWGLNGSLLMTQIGQNYTGMQGGAEADRKVKLTYVNVPLLLMKKIPGLKYPSWISFGPEILFLLKADQQYQRDEGGSSLPNPEGMAQGDITDRFKPIDLAVNFSLNRMIEINYFRSIMFLLTFNSSFGLTDINSADWQIPNTKDEYGSSHNFYVGVKAGLMFKVARIGGRRW